MASPRLSSPLNLWLWNALSLWISANASDRRVLSCSTSSLKDALSSKIMTEAITPYHRDLGLTWVSLLSLEVMPNYLPFVHAILGNDLFYCKQSGSYFPFYAQNHQWTHESDQKRYPRYLSSLVWRFKRIYSHDHFQQNLV